MARPAIGFYWTLPVPWAGFTSLSADPEEAAGQSRTIRYQREVIRRYAKENGFELVAEHVFLEIEPDRVSDQMQATLVSLRTLMRAKGAALLVVDFAREHGQRRNYHLKELAREASLAVEEIEAGPLMIAGKLFDPARHFSNWRARQYAWSDNKAERVAAALARAHELQAKGHGLAAIAERLNTEGLRSATGKPWTPDSLRKALKAN
ncbi:recombinase family protein [Ruegeria aquimaris]|uniref:Recombinase family protein n=1 Tax=Ruegeria aquimaris TaxID=2984333 RepID=A0ABT3ARV0_9RHOB|nr:recombinase family protein [Ruegeria sp. XHP0148]MCV2891409.1 recombinase family protein [Ruegeria sp. XHP0148]